MLLLELSSTANANNNTPINPKDTANKLLSDPQCPDKFASLFKMKLGNAGANPLCTGAGEGKNCCPEESIEIIK